MNVYTSPPVERIELPSDVAEVFRRAGDYDEPPETVREGLQLFQKGLDEEDASIELGDLYQSEPTRHAVHVGETVRHVPCVLDAMIVALTLDTRPIKIHSNPPGDDETVRFTVTDEEVAVTPDSAVVSIGIPEEAAADAAAVKDDLNEESIIPEGCSLINAFPDSKAYERWAADVSNAAVMELDIEEFVALAQRATRMIEGTPRGFHPEIAPRLAQAFDLKDPPDTLAETVEEISGTFEASLGRSLEPQDLCTTDDSPHEAYTRGQTYLYQCVLDAFIFGLLQEEPVTVHTVCQRTGEEVTVDFDDSGWAIVSAPDDAVMSYGIKRSLSSPEGEITPEKMYGGLCGYSHVFASRAEYEEWDRTTPEAVTEAWPLADGINVARRMVSAFDSFDDTDTDTGKDWDCC